jgi:predicted Zn-dependent protease
MKRRLLDLERLSSLQQGLLAAVLIAGALLIGSLLYLAFAMPSGWLIPTPRTQFERDILLAQEAVREAQRLYGTEATVEGRTPYADAQAQLVLARLDAGQTDRARRDALRLLDQFGDNPLIVYAAARAQFDSGRVDQTRTLLEGLLDQRDALPAELLRETYRLQSHILLADGRYQSAFETLLDGARIVPASIPYFEEAAQLALEHDRFDDATVAFALALTYNPDSVATRNSLISIRNREPVAFERGLRIASEQSGVDIEELLR